MNKIIVLRGLQASGKSTYAKKWVSEDPKHRTRWNRDSLREMSQASYNPKLEAIMHDLMEPYLEGALLEGYDVILDDTNLSGSALYKIRDFIQDFEVQYQKKIELEKIDLFDITLEGCLQRNRNRGMTVPEEAIRGTWERYKDILFGISDPWDSIFKEKS